MLKGNVEALDLVQLLQLIADNGCSGRLRVRSNQRYDVLKFIDGRLQVPGDYSSGEQRLHLEEALYDLLFQAEATFIFEVKKDLPEDRDAIMLDATSILMEAARRSDEWDRIKRELPSSKIILAPKDQEGFDEANKQLAKAGCKQVIQFGFLSVADICRLSQAMPFPILAALCTLVEEGLLSPMPAPDVARFIARGAESTPRLEPMRLFEWLHEHPTLEDLAPDYDNVFLRSAWLDLAGFGAKASGPRALRILSRVIRYKENVEFTALTADSAICLSVMNRVLKVRYRGKMEARSTLDRLVDAGQLSTENRDKARKVARQYNAVEEQLLVERGLISIEEFKNTRVEELVDLCFNIFTWNDPMVLVHSKTIEMPNFESDRESKGFTLAIDDELYQNLRKKLLRWKVYQNLAPSTDAIFLCIRPTPPGLARRAHDRCDGRRRVRDLLAMAKASGQELMQFLYEAKKSKRIRPLTREEHEARIEKAKAAGRSADIVAYCKSARAFGDRSEELKELLQEELKSEGAGPRNIVTFSGTLGNFHLAEIIQALLRDKAEGTLRIKKDSSERLLHFVDGAIWMLVSDDPVNPHDLLTESTELLLDSLSGMLDVDDQDSMERHRGAIIEDLLEALFWDGAGFEFVRNLIPSEFYTETKTVTKLRIPEDRFLFDAMRRLAEWDELRSVLDSHRAIPRFVRGGKEKVLAIDAELGLLIDGRTALDDLARSLKRPTLDIYRSIAELVEQGHVRIKGRAATTATKVSGRFRWDLSA